MAFPWTTHQWLQPLYRQLNSPTGTPAFYGYSGYARIATGGIGVLGATNLGVSGVAATGLGNSGLYYHLARAGFNGGTGTVYTLNDIVTQLKNMGILPL